MDVPPDNLAHESTSNWRFVILLSRFFIVFLDAGISKSFGVLITEMIKRYETNYAPVAFICSIPPTLTFILAPLIQRLMAVFGTRVLCMSGGFIAAASLFLSPYSPNLIVFAMTFVFVGIGMSMTAYPVFVTMDEYFGKKLLFWSSLGNFGIITGAFIMPLVVERSLEAYGYHGAYMIMGGLLLNAIVCGATLRSRVSAEGIGRNRPRNGYDTTKIPASACGKPKKCLSETDDPEIQRIPDACTGESISLLHYCTRENREESNERCKCGANETCICTTIISTFLSHIKSTVVFKEPMVALMIPAMVLDGYVYYAWLLFLVPHAEGCGIEPSRAVLLSTMAGISGILGRCIFLIVDHLNINIFVFYAILHVFSSIIYFVDPLGSSFLFLSVTAVLQAIPAFNSDSIVTAIAKLVPTDKINFQSTFSLGLFMCSVGTISGDILSGYILDVTGSYTNVFLSLGVFNLVLAINFIIYLLICRYRKS